jgi:hypothetical protein
MQRPEATIVENRMSRRCGRNLAHRAALPEFPSRIDRGLRDETTEYSFACFAGEQLGENIIMIKRKLVVPIAAAVAATALSLGSGNAVAAIMCDALSAPVAIPQTTAGIYVNFVTDVINVSPAAVPGWDFNPYGSSAFSFFWPTTVGNVGGGLLTGGKYAALAAGVMVDATGTYSNASGTPTTMADWRAGATDKYAGIRIVNEGTLATNYAWVQLTTTGPTTGLPGSFSHYCYQDDGTGILTGDAGVLAPPTVAKSFTPASVTTNTNSAAAITLTNPNASAITLTADLVDTLPAGLVTNGAASTTCTGTASSTSGTLTLGTGATIPASGSCILASAVQSATAGSYINAIAAGALQTNAGNNAAPATATLTVTDQPFIPCSGGLDEIFCDGFDGSGGLVAGEDNVMRGLMAVRAVY